MSDFDANATSIERYETVEGAGEVRSLRLVAHSDGQMLRAAEDAEGRFLLIDQEPDLADAAGTYRVRRYSSWDDRSRSAGSHVMRWAASRAAPKVAHRAAEWPLERALEDAVSNELSDGVVATLTPRRTLQAPTWEVPPGPLDVHAEIADCVRLFAELKVENVGESLSDLFKLLALVSMDPGATGYLVVAAKRKTWDGTGDCAALFESPAAGGPATRLWDSREAFTRWNHSWQELLAHGPARPASVPSRFMTTYIAAEPMGPWADYELRAIAVEPAGRDRLWFANGMPIG
jgi:hypothetical protein